MSIYNTIASVVGGGGAKLTLLAKVTGIVVSSSSTSKTYVQQIPFSTRIPSGTYLYAKCVNTSPPTNCVIRTDHLYYATNSTAEMSGPCCLTTSSTNMYLNGNIGYGVFTGIYSSNSSGVSAIGIYSRKGSYSYQSPNGTWTVELYKVDLS